MFIVSLTYKKPLEEVDKHLNEHIEFLDKHYKEGFFICSGRKNPRTGGIIILNAKDRNEVEKIISEDPFYINAIAEYEIVEFLPTKFDSRFEVFIR
jgi:uncharacterized protein YciI